MSRHALTILLAFVARPAANGRRSPAQAPVAVAARPRARFARVGKGAAEAGSSCTSRSCTSTASRAPCSPTTSCRRTCRSTRSTARKLCDYFKLLGAECSKVQRVDFHVGTDTLFVTGADLRKQRNVTFRFDDGLGGRPHLDGTLAPGVLGDVVVWVKEQPGGMLRDDGRRGVHVNVDGRLVAKIKRNLLEGNVEPVVEPRPGDVPRYRLLRLPRVALGDGAADSRHRSHHARRARLPRRRRRARRRRRVHRARQGPRRDDVPHRRPRDSGARRRRLGRERSAEASDASSGRAACRARRASVKLRSQRYSLPTGDPHDTLTVPMKADSAIDPRLRVLFLIASAVGIFLMPRLWMAATAAAVLAVAWLVGRAAAEAARCGSSTSSFRSTLFIVGSYALTREDAGGRSLGALASASR